MLPEKSKYFFSPSLFLKFERDENGRIDIVGFFHQIVRKVNLYESKI